MAGSLIIKPTKHEDFYLKYGLAECGPVRWGTRLELTRPEFQLPILDFIVDAAELTGAADGSSPIPELGWDQRAIRIRGRVEGEVPGYAATVKREDLRAFCYSWDMDRRLFRPEEGIVTWSLLLDEAFTIIPSPPTARRMSAE